MPQIFFKETLIIMKYVKSHVSYIPLASVLAQATNNVYDENSTGCLRTM
jgi:hypothetical protein